MEAGWKGVVDISLRGLPAHDVWIVWDFGFEGPCQTVHCQADRHTRADHKQVILIVYLPSPTFKQSVLCTEA